MTDRKSSSQEILVLIVLLLTAGAGVVFFYWLPKRRAAERADDEKSARSALCTLSTAEADFRANDRDRNGVEDFWTGDVAGLSVSIGQDIASADVRPIRPVVPTPIPHHGYYFAALLFEDTYTPPEPYGQDTDQRSGKVHHLSKFGFVAFPADPASGRRIHIINENNTIFHRVVAAPPPKNWPTDREIVQFWSKID